jgi:hypothetical protein
MEMHHPEVDGWLFLCFPRLLFFRPSLPCSSTIRDQDAISSTLRRYIMHASWMLNLPVSMAANTIPKPRNLQALELPYLQTNSPTLGMLIVVTKVTVFALLINILLIFSPFSW